MHEREIANRLDLNYGTLHYHLKYLEKRELVVTRTDGHYTQYYATGKVSRKDKKLLIYLRQKAKRRIIIHLLTNGPCMHKTLCEYIGLARSTTSFHLNILVKSEIIAREGRGREVYYHVCEPEYLSDLIITFEKSFGDNTVNKFAETWNGLYPSHLNKKKKKS